MTSGSRGSVSSVVLRVKVESLGDSITNAPSGTLTEPKVRNLHKERSVSERVKSKRRMKWNGMLGTSFLFCVG